VEGQSIRDIATITGFPENTVKSHLLRGKKNLADYLRRNGYGS
jgi:RNA polymerase sigma-70 factor (ECF subfamily)